MLGYFSILAAHPPAEKEIRAGLKLKLAPRQINSHMHMLTYSSRKLARKKWCIIN